MHKSKGLEFEHVLLYGLGRLPGSSGRSVLSWTDLPDEHGSERKVISPVGPRVDVDNDPVHRFIEQSESAKDWSPRGAGEPARAGAPFVRRLHSGAQELAPARAYAGLPGWLQAACPKRLAAHALAGRRIGVPGGL